MCKPNTFRIYRQETSRYIRKDDYQLVKCYGCNGVEHRIQYFLLQINDKGNTVHGKCDIKPDKVLGSSHPLLKALIVCF